MKFFTKPTKTNTTNQPIIIVSGLPRSGTSMMMRMLAEGGLPIVTDELRRADDDNPNGYFELEIVRQLKEGNFTWLNQANGKAVKVISALLEYLPKEYQYKVIFMERDPKETLASQKIMLDHREQTSRLSDEEMEDQFHTHLAAMKPWLVRQPNMEVMYVNYNTLVMQPQPYCDLISEFLDMSLNRAQMLTVPDEHLYRNRATSEK